MTDLAETEPAAAAGNGQPSSNEGWSTDRRGRLYVTRPDGGGAVFRQGEETVDAALKRAAEAPPKGKRDKRPRAKSKAPKRPPPPSSVDLKELEKVLTEALSAPAMAAAMFGDEWAANHFTDQAPNLARNLVLASEHNPWLRRKLEGMVTGQDAAMKMIAMLGVAGALFGYAVPPIVYFLNLPVPDQARAMFGIPPARKHAPEAPHSPLDDTAATVTA